MEKKIEPGKTAYVVESNLFVRKVTVVSVRQGGDLIVVRFDNGGGTCVRRSRLYDTEAEARASFKVKESKQTQPEVRHGKTPWS